MKKDVGSRLENDFIREAKNLSWVSNPMLVRKPTKNLRIFIDYSNLNQACHKDSLHLPKTYNLVDTTIEYELLSFMNVYFINNLILMEPPNENNSKKIKAMVEIQSS